MNGRVFISCVPFKFTYTFCGNWLDQSPKSIGDNKWISPELWIKTFIYLLIYFAFVFSYRQPCENSFQFGVTALGKMVCPQGLAELQITWSKPFSLKDNIQFLWCYPSEVNFIENGWSFQLRGCCYSTPHSRAFYRGCC